MTPATLFPRRPRRPGRITLEALEPRETPALFVAGSAQTFTGLKNNGHAAVGDFNEDGKPDVVLTNYGTTSPKASPADPGQKLTVLRGNGDGTFALQVNLTVGNDQHVSYAAVGDVDNDGHQDLVCVSTGNGETGKLTVFKGDGAGGFSKLGQVPTGGNNSAWVGLAQLTGDANLDLAVCSFGQGNEAAGTVTGNNLTVFQGDGKGGFDLLDTKTATAFIPTAGVFADFNGDGKQDLAVAVPGVPPDSTADQPNGSVKVFLGTGAGGFDDGTEYDSGGPLPIGLAVGKLNADGRPDLVVANAGNPDANGLYLNFGAGSNVSVLLNNGGSLQPPTALLDGTTTGGSKSVFAVTVADFDGDGKSDIAAITYGHPLNNAAARVPVWVGDGAGSFKAADGSPVNTGSTDGQYLAVGDFGGTAAPDLVTVGAANKVVALINQSTPSAGAAATTTALAAPPASGPYGTGFSLSATVSAAGTPTGTVTFLNGASVLGTADLATVGGQQVATFAVPGTALGAGSYTLTARYEGATGFASSTSSPVPRSVTPAAASITLTADPTRVTVGGTVTFTATVSSGAGTPGGKVSFFEGPNQIGGPFDLAAVGGKQVATFATADLTIGDHSVTAKYLGAANFSAAESAAQTVTVEATSPPPPPPAAAATTTTLESSANPSTVNQPVTFTVVVSAAAGTPAGQVRLYDGAALVGGPLNLATVGGKRQVTFTIDWLAAGDHALVARYAGSATFAASDSATLTQRVDAPAAATTTTLTAGPSPAAFGQAVTLTAVVAAGAGTPGGQVEFYRGATKIGNAVSLSTVGGKRQAAAVIAGGDLAAGNYTFTAKYLGAAGFAASDSAAVPLRVDPATPDVLLTGGGSSVAGRAVQFTVTVSSAAGTPAGRVSLYDGAAVVAGPVDLSAAGGRPRAPITVSTLAAGPPSRPARYEGGGNFGPAESTAVAHRVVAAGVTVGLAVDPSPSEEGSPVRLTATVSDPGGGAVAPTGAVTFRVGGTVLGTVNLAGGAASLTTAAIPPGSQTVAAEYAGDGAFLPGSATAVAVVNRRTVVVPPATPKPVLTGYKEFAVGAGDGHDADARFFNPDGSERFDLNLFPGFTGGVRVTSADFTGDGVADMVAGTGPGAITQVRIVDGVTRQTVFSIQPFEAAFTRGVFVTTGDITGDGTPDLVITPDEGGGPRVRVFDGKGFGLLADFFGIDDPDFRGGARAGIGDMNGDGMADLVVSAGFGGGPRVAGFSGASLAAGGRDRLFADFFVFEQGLRNGAYVTAGDLDGDGRADLVAGAGPGGGPRVLVLDAAGVLAGAAEDSRPLANYFAGNPDNRGGVRVAVRDLDGDTKADLVVGDGSGSGSRVTTYRGTAPTKPALSFDAFPGAMGGVFVG